VLESAAAQQQYERIRFVLPFRLESLNTSVLLLQRIHDFPFDLFTNHPRPLFWSHVTDRLYEAAVIRIAKLVLLSRNGSFRLVNLRDWLWKNIESEYRGELTARLKGVHFEQRLRSLRPRIRRLRNEVFARLDRWVVFGAGDPEEKHFLDPEKLSNWCALLAQLLDALSIGPRNLFLPVEYVTTNQESDIDEILRLTAEASGVLRMPEDNPPLWEIRFDFMKRERPEELAVITKYRRKFGLPTPWKSEEFGSP
jgi:hypothetical protein